MNKTYHVVTAVGENRTGIVADVSEIIYNSACNVEDSQMNRLGDQFALLTLVSSTDESSGRILSAACARLAEEKAIHAVVLPVGVRWPHCRNSAHKSDYVLRVVGQDRSGIVYRASRILSERAVDIIDLRTHITRAPESGHPIFTLEAHLAVPDTTDLEEMRRVFKALSNEMVLDISLGASHSARASIR